MLVAGFGGREMAQEGEHAPGPHPLVWLLLYLPYGVCTGYVTVTLAWLLSHAGASVAAVAALASLALAPNIWKFLWAPLVDLTLTAKRWFVLSNLVVAATLAAFAFLPLKVSMLGPISWLVLVNSVAATLTAIATNRMMAFDTTEAEKGRAGGWSQAGNLGGIGLGGGAGLYLAQHTGQPWIAAAAVAGGCLASTAALWTLRDPPRLAGARPTIRAVLAETGRDVIGLVRRRMGLLAVFVLLLPIGSGCAQNLWAAIAKDWGASADMVALIGGALQGLAGIAGCIAGGYLADRMDRKSAFLLFGSGLAAVSLAMAFGPRTPVAFLVFATLYNIVVGFCYAAYAAVVLEATGRGAAATKFNLLSSIANVPLVVGILVDGWAEGQWGARGMLLAETTFGFGAVALYMAVAWSTRGLSWEMRPGRRVKSV